METFYVTCEQFWDWFNRDDDQYTADVNRMLDSRSRLKAQRPTPELPDASGLNPSLSKRMKTDCRPRHICETEAARRADVRYSILYGRHKPGKKVKTWEGDGYLTLIGQMAHLCDLKGKMLEEPTVLDEIDMKSVDDLSELIIGNTEVQVVEVDKS